MGFTGQVKSETICTPKQIMTVRNHNPLNKVGIHESPERLKNKLKVSKSQRLFS